MNRGTRAESRTRLVVVVPRLLKGDKEREQGEITRERSNEEWILAPDPELIRTYAKKVHV